MPLPKISRRGIVKSSLFGLLAVSIPNIIFSKEIKKTALVEPELFHRYPAIDDAIVSEVVGASHFDLDKVKELVNHRPELARATWDWGFGDWESAIGAASHVGRRDIVEFLLSKGARPNIFTFAVLGKYEAVKAMIEARPGVQSISGPHGISLLQHAQAAQRMQDQLSDKEQADIARLIEYLESLATRIPGQKHIPMEEHEKEKYLGDYMYGEGPDDGFSVKLNMRKLLSLGKIGNFGGALYRKGPHVFAYNGINSVEIEFTVVADEVTALIVREPDLVITAKKV